jgi:hypothetical protein
MRITGHAPQTEEERYIHHDLADVAAGILLPKLPLG